MDYCRYKVLFISLISLLFILNTGICLGQSGKFLRFSEDQGLSHTVVNCIYQDDRGFLWLGSQDGLNRYDGYEFSVYKTIEGDESTISGNYVNHIIRKDDKHLWIATENGGICEYDRDLKIFHHIPTLALPDSQMVFSVKCLLKDHNNTLWVGSIDGLFYYDDTSGHLTRPEFFEDTLSVLHNQVINSLFEDKQGNIWIGGFSGIARISPDRKTLHKIKFLSSSKDGVFDEEINKIFASGTWGLLAGTNNGLYEYDEENGIFRTYLSTILEEKNFGGNEILDLVEDNNYNLWVATFGGGLIQITPESEVTTFAYSPDDPKSLSNDFVFSLLVDKDGNLWSGTYGSGLNLYDPYQIRFSSIQRDPDIDNTLISDDIFAITQDLEGNFWFGTDLGLNRYDPSTNAFMLFKSDPQDPYSLSGNNIYSLITRQDGSVWIGTAGYGINQFAVDDGIEGFRNFMNNQNFQNLGDDIYCLYEDKNQNLWIGSDAGLRIIEHSGTVIGPYQNDIEDENSLSNNSVQAIYEDHEGIIWVGTFDGLNRLEIVDEDSVFIRYVNDPDDDNSLSGNTVQCISEDFRDQLWIGTDGGGLSILSQDRQEFNNLSMEDGLADNYIYGIIEDVDSNVWISTNNGLCKLVPQKKSQNFSIITYNSKNGLTCDAHNLGAYYQGLNNYIYFGCSDGLTFFKLDNTRGNRNIPDVVITDFLISYKSVPVRSDGSSPLRQDISETENITLGPHQNNLDFQFASLNYLNSQNNEYAYILEGLDEDWRYVKNRRIATYTEVPPGDYVFRVKASNDQGIWNEEGVALTIHIRAPFYRTFIFYFLSVLLSIGMIMGYVNIRTRKLEQNRRILENKVRERTEEVMKQKDELEKALENLKSTQSQLIQAEKMASLGQLTAGVAHEINNPINFVSGNISPLQRDVEDLLEVIRTYENIVEEGGLKDKFLNVDKLKEELDYQFLVTEIKNLISGIQEGANRTTEIVKGLRNFSRVDEEELKYANLNQGLDSTLLILRNEIRHRVEVVKEFGEIPDILCYPGKLNQVFMNIVTNAIQAISENGIITIRTYKKTSDVYIEIEDNGIGISKENVSKIFEPFYTTKTVGEGTGLGLSISYGIVKDHNGSIRVKSELGKGTTFIIKLPVNKGDS
ncbi:two-component regulator propeller domain-containing protein [Bacteroidota bacterium]